MRWPTSCRRAGPRCPVGRGRAAGARGPSTAASPPAAPPSPRTLPLRRRLARAQRPHGRRRGGGSLPWRDSARPSRSPSGGPRAGPPSSPPCSPPSAWTRGTRAPLASAPGSAWRRRGEESRGLSAAAARAADVVRISTCGGARRGASGRRCWSTSGALTRSPPRPRKALASPARARAPPPPRRPSARPGTPRRPWPSAPGPPGRCPRSCVGSWRKPPRPSLRSRSGISSAWPRSCSSGGPSCSGASLRTWRSSRSASAAWPPPFRGPRPPPPRRPGPRRPR
mmetsp:Transcript_11420/g.40557  ORF Transcript_11420/g.40557 Transcript_11420/m.40557 type:complete len:282 (+) Transcript_11420:770-1615(+)